MTELALAHIDSGTRGAVKFHLFDLVSKLSCATREAQGPTESTYKATNQKYKTWNNEGSEARGNHARSEIVLYDEWKKEQNLRGTR